MAQKVQVQLIDDLDGSDADGTVRFGLDGAGRSNACDLMSHDYPVLGFPLILAAVRRIRGCTDFKPVSAPASRCAS